jgi:hemerythrin
MTTTAHFKQEHRELLALAQAILPDEAPWPAVAEKARLQLMTLSTRLQEHLQAEAATITGLCRIGGGAISLSCTIRQREAESLLESMSGMVRRWGHVGAISRDAREFISVWQVFLASLQRLQTREEGDIYGSAGDGSAKPIAAPPATGIPGVDRDHEQMFAMIGGLRAAIGGGLRHIDARMAAELASYTERHMADEEAIMAATNFPGLDDHRQEHHLARAILLGFRNDYQDGRVVEAATVLEFLERWLATHIAVVDVAMATYATEAGWQP